MEYEEFLGIFASRSSDSNYDKESDELRKKYAELESKLNEELKSKAQEIKEKNKEMNAKEKKIASLEAAVTAYAAPIEKKETSQDRRVAKINALLGKPYQNPLTVRTYHKIFKLMQCIDDWDLKSQVDRRISDDISLVSNKYPDPDDKMGYFKLKRNLKQLRRYHKVFDMGHVSDVYKVQILINDYEKELKDKWSKISEHAPFYGIIGTTLAGVIGSSIYFHFSEYVASAGIGAAVSSLVSATAGVVIDKIRCEEYEATTIGAIGGAILGAISGPVSYGYINYLEKSRETPFFDNIAADVFAKSAIGGVAGPLAALILIALLSIPTKKN